MIRKRILSLALALCFVAALSSFVKASNTINNVLVGDGHNCIRIIVPSGSGNWATVNLNPNRKYYVRNFGFDHLGATANNRVKIGIGVATEPDVSGNVTFAAETDTDILKVDDIVYPIRGTSVITMKAETSEVMVEVRNIEVLSATERQ